MRGHGADRLSLQSRQGDQESPFARAAQAEAWQSCERLLHQRDSPLSVACRAGGIEQAHQKVFQESVINLG